METFGLEWVRTQVTARACEVGLSGQSCRTEPLAELTCGS